MVFILGYTDSQSIVQKQIWFHKNSLEVFKVFCVGYNKKVCLLPKITAFGK